MTRSNIGGPIDSHALSQLFGETGNPDAHRPRDRREFQRAARDLTARGLKPDDVARLLGLSRRAVLDLLAEHLPEVRPRHRGTDP